MATVNVIAAVLTLTFSGSAFSEVQIFPLHQLVFISQSASIDINSINSSLLEFWYKHSSGASVPLYNCSCVEIMTVNNKNNKSNTQQLYFNSTTTSDAGRYFFFPDGDKFKEPSTASTLSLLDVAVETNASYSDLAVWDNVNVTCTLFFYNGDDVAQTSATRAPFTALITIKTNNGEQISLQFMSNTSSGNVSYHSVYTARNQYNCTATISDNNVNNNNAVLKTKTVTTKQYILWNPVNIVNVNVSHQMTVNVWDILSCSADVFPTPFTNWEKLVNGNQWSLIHNRSALNLDLVQNKTFRCTASNVIRGTVYNKSSDTFCYELYNATSGKVTVVTKTSAATPAPFTPLSSTNVVSNSAIAIGVGVGLGVGLPIVILVVVVCVVCACRRKARKTRDETKPENTNDVSEHIDDTGYSMADSTLPGQRTSTHLTVVDNNVYSSTGYADVKQSSPSVVALRPQPEGGNNVQVYDEIRMSMINSIMTKTDGHVSKATSPPPVLPQDSNHLSVPETGVSLSDSQTDLTLVDSIIYSSAGTDIQLQGEEADAATTFYDIDDDTVGEASES